MLNPLYFEKWIYLIQHGAFQGFLYQHGQYFFALYGYVGTRLMGNHSNPQKNVPATVLKPSPTSLQFMVQLFLSAMELLIGLSQGISNIWDGYALKIHLEDIGNSVSSLSKKHNTPIHQISGKPRLLTSRSILGFHPCAYLKLTSTTRSIDPSFTSLPVRTG